MADPLSLATLIRLRADRCHRERCFPGLPDPAFDILVDLALNTAQGKSVSVTSACLAAFVPSTTGLRHVGLLVGEGLVERIPDNQDARRVFLELTERGAAAVSDWLGCSPARTAA